MQRREEPIVARNTGAIEDEYLRFASGFACHGRVGSDPGRRGRGFWLEFVDGDVKRVRRCESASVPSAVSLPQPHTGEARHQVQLARIQLTRFSLTPGKIWR